LVLLAINVSGLDALARLPGLPTSPGLRDRSLLLAGGALRDDGYQAHPAHPRERQPLQEARLNVGGQDRTGAAR
jgi:hypothetical protein